MTTKKGLGKGLGALITQTQTENAPGKDGYTGVLEIDINKIEPNRNQPRKHFDEDALNELADSIREHGILQPLIVTQENEGYYSITAGERRWRAARLAKLTTVPVIIKDYNEPEALQVALIENLQRENINPIEEAVTYKRLIDEFFFRQEDIAAKIGKSRSYVSFCLSLLQLDSRVGDMIAADVISASVGKILLLTDNGDTQFQAARHIAEQELTAAAAKTYIETLLQQNETKTDKKPKPNIYAHLERDLNYILNTRVSIKDGKNKGKIEIEYHSPEDLDRLIGFFKERSADDTV